MKFWFFGFGRETIAKDFFLGVENPFHIAEMQSRQIIVQAFKQANLEYNSLLSVRPLFAFFIQHHVLNINCIKELKKKKKNVFRHGNASYDMITRQIRYEKKLKNMIKIRHDTKNNMNTIRIHKYVKIEWINIQIC